MTRYIKFFLVWAALCGLVKAETSIISSNQYAFSGTVGWISCRGDETNGLFVGENVCSGYVYSATIGWIDMGRGLPTNGVSYGNQSADDYGVNVTANSDLSGFAYSENVGWINFETNGQPRISRSSGNFSGYAYSPNAGWLSLSNSEAFVQTRLQQSIGNFNPASTNLTTTNEVELAATASSGLSVIFAVASGPGVISGDTNLTFSGTGTVFVTASQTGNVTYVEAEVVTNTYTITKVPQTLTFNPTNQLVYQSLYGLQSTAEGTGGVSYSVISGPGSISGGTNLTADSGTGTIEVKAEVAEDATYQSTAVTALVTCVKASQTISFASPGNQLATNEVGLAASSDSGLIVSFSVPSGPASISGGTNLSFTTAGQVSVVAAQAGDTNWNAAVAVTNTFSVSKAVASVSITDVAKIYNGSAQTATVGTVPGGLTVNTTYGHVAAGPTNAGSYEVIATIDELKYEGASTNTMVISKAIDTITFSATNQVYDGTARIVGGSSGSGEAVTISYDGSGVSPTHVGTYSVTGVVDAVNWVGTNTTVLTVSRADQIITFPVISDQVATASVGLSATAGSGLTVSFAVPSGPGSISGGTNLTFSTSGTVSVVATQMGDANWNAAPAVTNAFSVSKDIASVTLHGLTNVYDGVAQTVAVVVAPTNLTVDVTYDGLVSGPTNAGTYSVSAVVDDSQYQGGATGLLIVARAVDTLTFSDTNYVFDGTQKYVTSNSANAQSVEITYAGALSAPSNAGTYAVTGTVDAANWTGTNTTVLTISKASQTIAFPAISDQLTTANVILEATASSGQLVTFAVTNGPAVIVGGTNMTFSTSGTVHVVASQTGDANWETATPVTNTFLVTKDVAAVNLSALNKVYTGIAQQVTVDTVPTNLTVNVTYDGVAVGPTNAGSYEVIALVDDALYQGGTTGVLVIARALDTISFGATNVVYDGMLKYVTTNSLNGQDVDVTYAGQLVAPSNAGTYAVTGTVDTVNWAGTNATMLTVSKAEQTIIFPAISDQVATASVGLNASAGSGLTVSFAVPSGPGAISGGTNLTFSTSGTVSVVATQMGDANWNAAPAVTNAFNVTKNTASVTLDGLTHVYDGLAQTVTVVVAPTNLTVNVTYDGLVSGPTNAGTYSVSAVVDDLQYQGSATGLLIVARAVDVITFSDTNYVFDGTQKYVTSNSANAQPVEITYAGALSAPSNAGTYAVTGTVDTANWAGTNTTVLTISKAGQTIVFPAITNQLATAEVVLEATASSGLSVSFAVANGPAVITGGTNLSFSTSGTVSVVASQPGDTDWAAAPSVTNTFEVRKDVALVNLSALNKVYNGSAQLIVVDTVPTNLTVDTTYDGLSVGPTNAGSYEVIARVNDALYQGGATGVLVIARALDTLSFGATNALYDGTGKYVTTNSLNGQDVTVTYDGQTVAPSNAGIYAVTGTVDTVNWAGTNETLLTISKGTQIITFPAIPPQYHTNTVELSALVTSSNAIAFSVLSGPGSISGDTHLSFNSTGLVYVTADQSGDSNWLAASTVTNVVTVNPSPQNPLVFMPISPQKYLTTNVLTTSGGSGTGAVSYVVTYGPGSIVDGNGLLVNSGSGVVTVVATKARDDVYNETATTALVYCARADQTIQFIAISDQYITNQTLLNATASSGLDVSFSVADGPATLQVRTNGTYAGYSATGVVNIAAAQAGTTNWNASVSVTNSFTVLPVLPSLERVVATQIDETSIDFHSVIASDGGTPITQRGVCWSKLTAPTLADRLTLDGAGDGTYTSVARALDAGTEYYVRSYAINLVGTNYGPEIAVTTSNEPPTPPAVDYLWNASEGTAWTNENNWNGSIVPAYSNTARFSVANVTNVYVDLDGNRSIGGITLTTNADMVVLRGGDLMITNRGAQLAAEAGVLTVYNRSVLGGDAVISNVLDSRICLQGGIQASGSVTKNGAGWLYLGYTNSAKGDVSIHEGHTVSYGDISMTSTNRLLVGVDAAFEASKQVIEFGGALRITNGAAGSVAAQIDGKLQLAIGSNDYERLELGNNSLELGTNSVLTVSVVDNGLSITSQYTLARFTSRSGTFGQVNGLTAHIISYNSNSITLEPTFVWDGSVSTNWSEGLNWTNSLGPAPGSENDAGFVPQGGTNIVVGLDTNPVVRSVRALGSGLVRLEGITNRITLTNNAVASGEVPAIQSEGTVFELLCDIKTVPGARINALGGSTTVVRIVGTISSAAGVGEINLDGSGRVELLGTNTFGSSTNWLRINGASLFVDGDAALGHHAAGIVFTNGGSLNVSNDLVTGREILLDGNGGIGTGSSSNSVTITNRISGRGLLTVTGNGVLVLTASNLLGGAEIAGGALEVMGQLSSNGDVGVSSNAVLRGHGRIQLGSSEYVLHIRLGAVCAPGTSVGTIAVDGSMTVDGALDIEVENGSNDVVIVRDALILGDASSLRIQGEPDGVSSYTFVTFASRSGTFGLFDIPKEYVLNYDAMSIVLQVGAGSEAGTTNVVRAGAAVTIDVAIDSNTAWTAVSTSDWVKVVSGDRGQGDGSVTLAVAANTDRERSSIVWIAGRKYTVRQQASTAVYLDFDGDSKADIACYWPDRGIWYVLKSSDNLGMVQSWGWTDAVPAAGDYDGDGKYDMAVFSSALGEWYIWRSSDQTGMTTYWKRFVDGVAVPADYDGDGITDEAVYRSNGEWYILASGKAVGEQHCWGWTDAVPVPGDYDGDGLADLAVYWPEGGTWYVLRSSDGQGYVQRWGWSGAEACQGDYDGDGCTDLAVYWPEMGRWDILLSSGGTTLSQDWGWNRAAPVPADHDGDGLYDVTVYSPSEGYWYIWQTLNGHSRIQVWGWDQAHPVNPQYWINRAE